MIRKKFFIQVLMLAFIMSSSTKEYSQAESQLGSFFNNSSNEIILTHRGDEYGEWGGDETTIRVYRNILKQELIVDLKIKDGSENFPYAPKSNKSVPKDDKFPIIFEKSGVELSYSEMRLIEKSVIELAENKIKNEKLFLNAGIFNSIIFSDSSLIIKDFPSIEWNSFQELVKLIREK